MSDNQSQTQSTLIGEPAGEHTSPFAAESDESDESPDESDDRPEPRLTDFTDNNSISDYE